VVRQAVAVLRSAHVADYDDALLTLSRDKARPEDVRIAAVAAVAPRLTTLEPALYDFLLGHFDREVPPLERLAAAQALGSARLSDGQLDGLARVIATAGGLELPHLLAPYEHNQTAAVGKGLVDALARSPALTSLTPDALRRTLHGYPAEVRDAAAPLLQRLAPDAEQQKARLAELEPLLTGGDRGRGRDVFFGKKATCGLCHAVRGEGGHIGPDLSTIGAIRSGRDVLESIVFPSASFARGYEPYVVATRGGTVHTGTLARETAEAIFLHAADRSEIRVARADIDSIEPGRVSIMPQGLDAQLSRQELGDLLAFLQSLR
jgi:putative heme-binding domain-containing protein